MLKAFERAVRRAEIPIAFSEGFNPHPRLSFASALAVGVTSEREYADLELKDDVDLRDIIGRLAAAMPPGIEIKAGRFIPDNAPALMAEVNRAAYKVLAPVNDTLQREELDSQIEDFMSLPEVVITKWTRKGPRQKNIRPGIVSFEGYLSDGEVEFSLITVTGSEGNIRPEEVVSAFTKHSGLPIDSDSLYIRRMALYIEKGGKLVSPMDIN